ncbi:hypothetical protein N9985_03295 [Gammaproteobacteria bacterium]|nr:hypothetical protein [Gammaproteobacteria bacterium]
MSYFRKNVLLIIAGALIASQGLAQDAQNAATAYADREVGETVVYGSREVDPTSADPKYEEFWREQLLDQIALMRLEDETEWRATLTYPLSDAPNVVLGYDPKFDLERQQDLDLLSESSDIIKTATVVSARF